MLPFISMDIDGWMDGMSGKHAQIQKYVDDRLYAHICVRAWPNFSISHFNPIQSVYYFQTLLAHHSETVSNVNTFVRIGIPSTAYTISLIHSLTHSFIRSFIHWRWAPSFFVYSLYKKSYKNICRNAYWNQMLRTVENTVIQRYFSPFLVVVHIPCTSACVCIRMRHNGLFAMRVQCVTYKTSQILYEVERTVVMNEWMNVEYILGAIEKERGFYSTRPIHTKYKNTCIFFINHSRRVCSTMNANQMGHILNVFIALCTFHIIFIHTAHIYIDVLRHFGTLLFFPIRYEINHELILSVFSFISEKNYFTWNGNDAKENTSKRF